MVLSERLYGISLKVWTPSLTSIACVNGTKYSKGMVLSVGQTGGLPDFGRVLEICVVDGCISFIMELFAVIFLEHLRCYQLARRDAAATVVVDPDDLNDYIPLAAYPVKGSCSSLQGHSCYIKVMFDWAGWRTFKHTQSLYHITG